MSVDYARRAQALVGVPFKPQGRDPKLGIDCVGLALEVFGLSTELGPRNYRLRGDHLPEMKEAIATAFRQVRVRRSGDLLLLAIAADQFHLAVCTGRGFVHADARLRRVVETPGEVKWPLIGIYRKRVRRKG